MTAHYPTLRTLGGTVAGSILLLLLSLVGVSFAHGAVSGDQIQSEEDLKAYVRENTDRMVDKLDRLRTQHSTASDAFYQEMEQELTNFIDFRRIAARVMGRYARQASEEQRDAFVEKFKRSLFNTYAKALADTSDFEIRVNEARFLEQNKDRASVNLTVISESGKSYQVVYSLFKNNEGRWMMENVIVEGVNIGLAFRDRFQQEMEKHRGNVQAVIANWSGEVEELEEKTGVEGETRG